MKKLFLLAALCVAAAFSSCSKHNNEINHVEPPVPPETTPLAITFAEGNSLEFNVGETKTVHYTITGGSDKTVVTAEMQTPDDAYTVETTPTSALEGTIAITAKMPETENCVIVTVSDGSHTITASIGVTALKASFDGKTVTVETPGTLAELLSGYDTAKIIELTVIGNLNDEDIATLKNLPNLSILDMENVNLEVLPAEAFKNNKSLTSVKLPNTLKRIGTDAFQNCKGLTNITIPDSVTWIGEFAFTSCGSLTSVTIGNSVMTIGDYAFFCCSSLTSVTIPDSVMLIRGSAFMNCSSLTSVTIGNSVTKIGEQAFRDCSSLTHITIPDSVTTIGDRAFSCCSGLTAFYGKFASSDNRCLIVDGCLNSFAPAGLTSYTIPDSVTTIGNYAFYGCSSLTSITIPDSVTTIGSCAFNYCSRLTSVTIPNSVTAIGDCAFTSCGSLSAFYGKFASSDNRCLIVDGCLNSFAPAGLTSYTIPDSVTSIGRDAFMNCSNLTSITIPDGVTSIGQSAFSYCSGLKSVTIGNSVTEIGNNVFYGCSNLKSIYCKAQTPPSVGDSSAFDKVNATLYVPTGCKAAYAAADGWNKFTIIETEF